MKNKFPNRFFCHFLIPICTILSTSCVHSNNLESVSKENQQIDLQKELNSITENNEIKQGVTGISVTMQCPAFQNGKEVTYFSGVQSKDGLPMSENSLYQIGSNSKSFIAVLILQLEAEGKLSLKDTLSKFFPNEYQKWGNVTIAQMLNMTSGIKTYLGSGDDAIMPLIFLKPNYQYKTDELLDFVKDEELLFKPGSKWEYSNTNTALLGKIIEQVSKNSLESEIQQRILNSLQMNHTYYIQHLPKNEVPFHNLPNLMSGYFNFNKETGLAYETNGISMSSYNAAGSLISNTLNINKYIRSLFLEGNEYSGTILSQNQLHKMISLIDISNGKPISHKINSEDQLGYGFAFFSRYNPILKEVEYLHTGGTFGFLSKMAYIPEKRISYVSEINSDNAPVFVKLDETILRFIKQNCIEK